MAYNIKTQIEKQKVREMKGSDFLFVYRVPYGNIKTPI